jgi:cyclophilin family peptidyl-prolyl cis-trans isomerase
MKRLLLCALAGLVAGCMPTPTARTGGSEKVRPGAPEKVEYKPPEPVNPKDPVVILDTSKGIIKIELFEEKAPITVKNFLGYVADKFYDGTVFHRVMARENYAKDFMIQGGGFEPGMKQKDVKGPIRNESSNGLLNRRGTVAMARTPLPDSATSQFFINLVDNDSLNRSEGDVGYCVFGQVLEGMDVVHKIKAVRTGTKKGHGNVPVEDILINSVKRADK